MTEVPTPAAAPLRANCVEIEPVLTRKEKKNLEAKKKLDKTLKAMTRLAAENRRVEDDPNQTRPRTSLSGFWRKRKEMAKCCVFIGNLPETITDGEVRDFFKEDGAVGELRWLPPGRGNCMVYAQFKDLESATKACARDGCFYDTYKLRINLANDKTERSSAIKKRTGDDLDTEVFADVIQPTISAAKRARLSELPHPPRNIVSVID